MKATYTHRRNTTITRLIPFAFALMMVFTSLATTGCDTLDSNALEDEPHTLLFSAKSGEPEEAGDGGNYNHTSSTDQSRSDTVKDSRFGGVSQLLGPPVPADDDSPFVGPPDVDDDKPQVLGPPMPTDGGK